MQNFKQILTMNETYTIYVSTFIFALIAWAKVTPTGDESFIIDIGRGFLETGDYASHKLQPLLPLLLGFFSKLFASKLLATQVVFALSGVTLALGIHKIIYILRLVDEERIFLHVTLICLLPGLLFLGLYSASHLPYTALSVWGIYYFIAFLRTCSLTYLILCSLFIALSYLARVDGLILFFALFVYLFSCFYLDKKNTLNKKVLFLFPIIFLFIIFPWHLFLYNSSLFISSVVTGGWESTVWTDGPAKYFFGPDNSSEGFNLNENLIKPFVTNIVLFSEYLGSVRFFPIFLWPIIGIGLLNYKFNKESIAIFLPFFVSLSYLLFYVEIRYLFPIIPSLGIILASGFEYILLKYNLKFKRFFIFYLSLLITLDIGYLLYGNRIYQFNF